jgi:hypothetical protein
MRVQYAATITLSIITVCAVGFSTAERSIAAEVVAIVDNTKQNAPPAAASAAAAACTAAWTAADLNKNGVLDPDEALIYNAALTVKHKPAVTDTNLNQAEFLKDCEALTVHE